MRGTWPGAVRDGASASWTHARALPPTQTYVAEQSSKAPGVMNVICLAERSTVPVKPGQLPLRTRGAPAHMPGTPNHCLASGACLCARLRAHRGCINAPAESPDHLQQEDRSSGELGAAFPLHFSTVQGAAEASEKVSATARSLRCHQLSRAPLRMLSRRRPSQYETDLRTCASGQSLTQSE